MSQEYYSIQNCSEFLFSIFNYNLLIGHNNILKTTVLTVLMVVVNPEPFCHSKLVSAIRLQSYTTLYTLILSLYTEISISLHWDLFNSISLHFNSISLHWDMFNSISVTWDMFNSIPVTEISLILSLYTEICLILSLYTEISLILSLYTEICLILSLYTEICLIPSLYTEICLILSLYTEICLWSGNTSFQ